MKLHLLGYSESSLSRIIDVLWIQGYRDELVIIPNRPIVEAYPFAHPSLPCIINSWNDWKPDLIKGECFFSVTGTESKQAVFHFFLTQFGIERSHYTNIVHPSSIISDTVVMGRGCFIEPGSIITSYATLGYGVSINRGVTVGHHTGLGDFVTLNPGVHVAGHCTIGERTQIGIGAVVFNGVSIGSGTIIGGGSVVTRNMPANVIAWGNPCKVVKQNVIE